jgi:hypothetical protein
MTKKNVTTKKKIDNAKIVKKSASCSEAKFDADGGFTGKLKKLNMVFLFV